MVSLRSSLLNIVLNATDCYTLVKKLISKNLLTGILNKMRSLGVNVSSDLASLQGNINNVTMSLKLTGDSIRGYREAFLISCLDDNTYVAMVVEVINEII